MNKKLASLPAMSEQPDLHARAHVESTERTAAQICYDLLRRERQFLTLIQTLMDAGSEIVNGRVAYPKWVEYASRYEDMSPTST